jgi:carboxypeptidase PM20D1
MKLIMQAICAVLLILIGVIAFNTIRFGKVRNTPVDSAIAADIDITAAAERLASMVRIKTVSISPKLPAAANAFYEMHDYIAKSFPNAHAKMESEVLGDFSLLYRWPGSRPELEPILFIAHMDVVPTEQSTLSQWSHDPFSGTIADGFIWGRGTLDMKASLAGILEAAEYLVGQDFRPTRTLYLAFSHDEELGGSNGTAAIVKTLQNRNVKLLFTLDEGMPISMGLVPGV